MGQIKWGVFCRVFHFVDDRRYLYVIGACTIPQFRFPFLIWNWKKEITQFSDFHLSFGIENRKIASIFLFLILQSLKRKWKIEKTTIAISIPIPQKKIRNSAIFAFFNAARYSQITIQNDKWKSEKLNLFSDFHFQIENEIRKSPSDFPFSNFKSEKEILE